MTVPGDSADGSRVTLTESPADLKNASAFGMNFPTNEGTITPFGTAPMNEPCDVCAGATIAWEGKAWTAAGAESALELWALEDRATAATEMRRAPIAPVQTQVCRRGVSTGAGGGSI